MKRSLMMLLLLGGCIDDTPVTEDDVITSIAIDSADTGERVADGITPLPVKICVNSTDGRDPGLTAVLHTSVGKFPSTDGSDARSITLRMTSDCETTQLVPTTDVGPVTVTATVGNFSKSKTETLVAAKVSDVRIGAMGTLSSSAPSMIVVTATLDVGMNGVVGSPSKGTKVTFHADVEPVGAIGYFSDPTVTISDSNTVKSTYYASPAITKVTFTATALPAARPATTSAPFVVER